MKTLGHACITLTPIAALLAIWAPFGAWWQFLLTALVLLIVGAGILGQKAKPDETPAPNEPVWGSFTSSAGNRPTYGKKADQ